MRALPEFPVWKTASPPASKKWLAIGALVTLLTGGGTALLRADERGSSVIFVLMLLSLTIMGGLWLCRLLYYRVSVHHTLTWQQAVEQEQQHWWEIHQSTLALREILLIGPAGIDAVDWKRVLGRELPPPEARQELGGKTLRTARIFSSDLTAREQQLARSLVLLWKKTHSEAPISFTRVFWLGSEAAWQAFCAQMKITFPEVALPMVADIWDGEATLSQIAALLRSDKTQQFLLVGCYSGAATSNRALPTGESAVLWQIAADGPVSLTRGEVFSASSQDDIKEVCERAIKQSALHEPPEACVLFSHPDLPQLAESGWNITHHLQDSYWGYQGDMQLPIVISLAALHTQQQQQPCGWIANDTQHSLALGIVTPHGKG